MSILIARQLTKIYAQGLSLTKALDNITLAVDQGDFLGIMGPSGAGKSTLLNVLSTIDKATSGQVFINGQNISELKGRRLAQFRRDELGFIFQDFNLIQALNVQENISLPLVLNKRPPREIMPKLNQLAQSLQLSALLDKYPDELSVGQRQRVAAARALIMSPKILFADEPTGSLDSQSATQLLQYLQNVNQTGKMTIVMVTHDAFTASFCRRILFIRDGRIFSQVNRQNSRQEFFDRIIDMQATIGGGASHVF